MRLSASARRLARWVVRRGSRKVLWTQETANLGNFLYDWMQAHNQRAIGSDVVCLRTTATEPWIPVFGRHAEELVVRRADVRMTDRREKGLYNEWGVGFDEHDLAAFIEGFFSPSGVVDAGRVPPRYRVEAMDVVVNVRRGDYVTNPVNWGNYGFDVADYLRVALSRSRDVGGSIRRILVVSDGPAWCGQHLAWLSDECETFEVIDAGVPPDLHLAILANAPRLVLANSTFSYWGGYLSTYLHGYPAQVVAPWFHVRADLGGAAWQLDPRWSIVRDIPSGWALPAVNDGD